MTSRESIPRAALMGVAYLIGLNAGVLTLPLWLAYLPILALVIIAFYATTK